MKIIEETKDYIVVSGCPLCKQIGHRSSVFMSKIKDENGEWKGTAICKMCLNIFNIREEGDE